jgi:hypothetical protein
MKTILYKVTTWLKDTFLVIAEIIIGILMCMLFMVISIIGFFYTLIKHLLLKDYSAKRQFKPIMRSFTLVNDCFANASAGELLNDVLDVRENEIPYGSFQQTISSVTGLRFMFNQRDSKLRKALNKIDKDHCDNAPSAMELFYYKYKNEITHYDNN